MLRERGFLLEKGGVTGEGRLKRGRREGPESPHFIDRNFLSPFLSSSPPPHPPVMVQEKVNTRIFLRSILLSFPLSERVLQYNRISY